MLKPGNVTTFHWNSAAAGAPSIPALAIHSILISLFSCIFIPTIVLPIVFYHWLIGRIAPIFRPDLSHMLREFGPMVLQEEVDQWKPKMHMQFGFTVQSKEELDFEAIKACIEQRLVHARSGGDANGGLEYPELQQFCTRWAGYFFWKQEATFSIDDHVLRRDLCPGEDVHKAQQDFVAEPLLLQKSPWQILVIASHGPGPYHIVFKFHHVLADGYSGIRALMKLVDEPGPVFLPPAEVPAWQRVIWFKLTFPFHFVLVLARQAMAKSPALPWTPLAWEPLTGDRPVRQNVVISEEGVSMEQVKAIARRQGVAPNAVVQAALTGALRKSMLAKHGPETIPSHVSFPQGISSWHHPPGLCNLVRIVTYRLPIGEAHPLARLQCCDLMLTEVKNSAEGNAMFLMTGFAYRLPAVFPFKQVVQRLSPSAVIFTGNLPGPLNPLRLDGNPVTDVRFLILDCPAAFFMGMVSYAGRLNFICGGDSRVMSREEVREIGRLFREEFDTMEALA